MEKISIVVPCYNEEKTIHHFYGAISELYNNSPHLSKYKIELILVNDGSKDATFSIIHELVNTKKHLNIDIKGVNFSKNFGKEAAILAGLKISTGAACIVIDADLQHPVEIIPQMILEWENGIDVVDGVKKNRGRESSIYKLFSKLFYNIISKAAGFEMKNASDFKLVSRRAVDELLKLPENHIFFRGLSTWVGFTHSQILYEVKERVSGVTSWSKLSLFSYAIKNITSFSTAPLLVTVYLGIIFLLFASALAVYTLSCFFMGQVVSGYSTLILVILLVGSGMMIGLGIVGYYIKKIFEQVQGRPNFIISQVIESEEMDSE